LRLRLLHPAVAILSAVYLLWASVGAMQVQSEESALRKAGARAALMVMVQVLAGFANVYMLAPVWMQLLHLLIGDVVWITVVLLICEDARARSQSRINIPMEAPSAKPFPASSSSALPG
jgi:heme A synthase